jgi:hypothetical protein
VDGPAAGAPRALHDHRAIGPHRRLLGRLTGAALLGAMRARYAGASQRATTHRA